LFGKLFLLVGDNTARKASRRLRAIKRK